ncbi:MAG: bifunctional NADP-dependent methylenetetrahydromethanopterin dehydrogenase/methylenetetrahydrofolate dehydrogenase [Planctomycetia bacterium]|nr:bifunctional NADP-dependent methylenetetrahydromethanopterin dehydrogenase/methylenetetrahydrofolate dehydrogenase [Planctomycetia bacterium]
MSKPKILVQLDTDDSASVFDSVVALDAGVDHLLRHSSITPENVRERVHGAIFTRGGDDLRRTALFVGGSDVARGEQVLEAIAKSFIGPLRCSVMIDSGGANTTAAAAVLAATKHLDLRGATALVLAATGPVGQRVALLLARLGADVRLGSRRKERAEAVCLAVAHKAASARLTACATTTVAELDAALSGATLAIAAGAAGVELLPADALQRAKGLKVAIDLNAVPPLGVAGIKVTDKAVEHDRLVCYGAIGVGGRKMKIHKAAIQALFEANDRVLDAPEIFEIGRGL